MNPLCSRLETRLVGGCVLKYPCSYLKTSCFQAVCSSALEKTDCSHCYHVDSRRVRALVGIGIELLNEGKDAVGRQVLEAARELWGTLPEAKTEMA